MELLWSNDARDRCLWRFHVSVAQGSIHHHNQRTRSQIRQGQEKERQTQRIGHSHGEICHHSRNKGRGRQIKPWMKNDHQRITNWAKRGIHGCYQISAQISHWLPFICCTMLKVNLKSSIIRRADMVALFAAALIFPGCCFRHIRLIFSKPDI